jgi:hypothetical protein
VKVLNRIYLSRACCDKLGVLYNTPHREGVEPVIADPVHLLKMRDWDAPHKSTFRTFMFLEQKLHLLPDWGEYGHNNGWYKVLNVPNTRFFVTTDIDVELLQKQKDLLVDLRDSSKGQETRLLRGLVVMLDHMLAETRE